MLATLSRPTADSPRELLKVPGECLGKKAVPVLVENQSKHPSLISPYIFTSGMVSAHSLKVFQYEQL